MPMLKFMLYQQSASATTIVSLVCVGVAFTHSWINATHVTHAIVAINVP